MVLEIYLDIGSIIKQSYKISTQVSLLGPSFFCMQLSYDPVNLRFLTVPISQNVRSFKKCFMGPSTLAALLHAESLQAKMFFSLSQENFKTFYILI